MEIIINKPSFMNGVYMILQPFERKVYVGESNDIFRRFGEHIDAMRDPSQRIFGSNKNLLQLEDKRVAFFSIYKNCERYIKSGKNADKHKAWLYDETIAMYILREYDFALLNDINDNTGKNRKKIIDGKINISELTNILKVLTNNTILTKAQVMTDVVERKKQIAEIFNEFFETKEWNGIAEYDEKTITDIWNKKIQDLSERIVSRNRHIAMPYLITSEEDISKIVHELTGDAITKDTFELCKIEELKKSNFAEMIKEGQLDTTVFTTFGGYLGQLPATILATKAQDLKEVRFINNEPYVNNKNICEWAFKKLPEVDTRDFFETTNKSEEKKPKYIIMTYTSSKNQVGDLNSDILNPFDKEELCDFKMRMKEELNSRRDISIAEKIRINWKKKLSKGQHTDVAIPSSFFPEIISGKSDRAFLISKLFVLDGYLKNYSDMFEFYYAHYSDRSEKGEEIPFEITDCRNLDENIVRLEYTERIIEPVIERCENGNYRIVVKHEKIKKGIGQKCGRIRENNQEDFARFIENLDNYAKEDNEYANYRNVVIAELQYPYIVSIE